MRINEVGREVHALALEKGWWTTPNRSFGEICTLLHTEISEAFEEYRNGHGLTEIYYNEANPHKPEGIPIELADLAIRLFDNCAKYGINLEQAITLKHEYNKTRPYRHGGKLA